MCQTMAKYQTWSSDVSDGVGVTDMATAAVGIAEKDYHKVVVCSPTWMLLWFGAGFCKFKMLIRVTALRSKINSRTPVWGEILVERNEDFYT